jgi:hypothetical protein
MGIARSQATAIGRLVAETTGRSREVTISGHLAGIVRSREMVDGRARTPSRHRGRIRNSSSNKGIMETAEAE